ncbi:MAG TPA: hypothetical protein VIM69_06125, partial [Opitutaceae bacterium]
MLTFVLTTVFAALVIVLFARLRDLGESVQSLQAQLLRLERNTPPPPTPSAAPIPPNAVAPPPSPAVATPTLAESTVSSPVTIPVPLEPTATPPTPIENPRTIEELLARGRA